MTPPPGAMTAHRSAEIRKCLLLFMLLGPSLQKRASCEECQQFVHRMLEELQMPEATDKIVAYLSGAAFCENPQYEGEVEECQTAIATLIPAAFPVLFAHNGPEQEQGLCTASLGVC